MTDEEIIETLERCSKAGGCLGCAKAYMHNANCIRILETECLDLINRQKAEIERLKSTDTKFYKQKATEDFAAKIIAEIESAIQSNRDAINERIEKGHRDVGFESMCAGKILAMQGIRNFIEEEVNKNE